MAIIQLQRRLHEIGRIRLGQQVESRSGKKRPAALNTFRLTSSDRTKIAEAAKIYGGAVTTWTPPSGQEQFEVITGTDRLPVVVPPSAMAFSQHYELWSAGGCQRRCDGVTESISEQPCVCDPENRQCDIHTRLSVMLRDLSGLGVWRVDTQGFYAAVELQGAVEVITMAAGRGQMLPATLRLDRRAVKRLEEGVKHFVVPVLDIDVTPAQLLMGTVSMDRTALAPQAALTPVPESGARPPSIAEQVKVADSLPSRRRATPIRSTGILPRTAEQAAHGEAAIPEQGEETHEAVRMVTQGQLTKVGILLRAQGFDGSAEGRAARLAFCAAAIGRDVASSKELTFDEASTLITTLSEPAATSEETATDTQDAEPESGETLTPASDNAPGFESAQALFEGDASLRSS